MSVTSSLLGFAAAVQAFIAWARAVVRDDAPAWLSRLGRFPVARLGTINGSGALQPQGMVFDTILGPETVEPTSVSQTRSLPLRVVLNDDQVFTRTVSVNSAFARGNAAMLRARLARHCPIPLADAMIEAEVRSSDGGERLLVDMVVARRTDVVRAAELAASEAGSWSVVGRTVGGEFMSFSRTPPSGRKMLTSARSLAALAALSVLFLGGSWTDRLNKQEAALASGRADLLAQVRALREESDQRERRERLRPVTDSFTRLPVLLSAMEQIQEYDETSTGVWRIEYRLPGTLHVEPSDERQASLMIRLRTPGGEEAQ